MGAEQLWNTIIPNLGGVGARGGGAGGEEGR